MVTVDFDTLLIGVEGAKTPEESEAPRAENNRQV
jgi:hypothetical protein